MFRLISKAFIAAFSRWDIFIVTAVAVVFCITAMSVYLNRVEKTTFPEWVEKTFMALFSGEEPYSYENPRDSNLIYYNDPSMPQPGSGDLTNERNTGRKDSTPTADEYAPTLENSADRPAVRSSPVAGEVSKSGRGLNLLFWMKGLLVLLILVFTFLGARKLYKAARNDEAPSKGGGISTPPPEGKYTVQNEEGAPGIRVVGDTKKDVTAVEIQGRQTKGKETAPVVVALPPIQTHNWLVVGASATGKSHLMMNIPCQDYFLAQPLNKDWGVVACCDGAGSAKESHRGAQFVANRAVEYTREALEKTFLPDKKSLPDLEEWRESAVAILKRVAESLEQHAQAEEIDLRNLSSTLILLAYSPLGLLLMHVGDGRAGYKNQQGEWKSIFTPYKGQEANQTVFVTSHIWEDPGQFIGCNVIDEPAIAFTLMTDGCESYAFRTFTMDPESGKYCDLNEPFPNFLDPLLMAVRDMGQAGKNTAEIEQELKDFLEKGTKKLEEELDDKTLIVGQVI